MIKYLYIFLAVFLTFSCKTTKNQLTQVTTESEEVIEEESTVPDLVALDIEPMSDCRIDWDKKRLIVYKNEKRIGRLKAATEGQIYVLTQVDQKGYVVSAKIDDKNTSVEEDIWRNMALEIVNNYQFQEDTNAPKIDCGTIKFHLSTM